ncbi:STAS domain-containing protein [Vreelandella utahensis]|uniref:STAS domain-containing protein n=1 Tax=Vreelandella halophila TaxID=86177 RepID=UPI000987595E|nr:STAS domain-containing protein [Halomonas utahensis]
MFSIEKHDDGEGTVTLSLSGQFDFNAYSEFKPKQTEALDTPGAKYIVLDLSKLDYLDSAALGTLLLLREKAQDRSIEILIRGATGVVQEILEIAHFQRMFRFID